VRLKNKLAISICLGIAATGATFLAAGWVFTNRLIDANLSQRLKSESAQVLGQIESESRRALSIARYVAASPGVADALAAGDRAKLSALTLPTFDVLKADGANQFQFHLPPATSFLRVHAPAQFGDDLSAFRHTVVQTNRDNKPVSGLEGGVAGLGVRGVTPVAKDGRHVG
jgi:methyl-accepting chemotaxis protein